MNTRLVRSVSNIALLFSLFLASDVALFAQTTSDSALTGKAKSVALVGDDQAVTCTGVGMVLLSSDNATATSRTFTLTASALAGHRCVLVWDESSTDRAEFIDTGTQKLHGDWRPTIRGDTLSLISDGTNWLEEARGLPLVGGDVSTVTLTADDQAVNPAGLSTILLTSDNATATNRTFTLTASPYVGQRLTLIHVGGSNLCELADTGIQKLSATWTCADRDTLQLVSDGTNWVEVSRADN